jgi:hypothetical protein
MDPIKWGDAAIFRGWSVEKPKVCFVFNFTKNVESLFRHRIQEDKQ